MNNKLGEGGSEATPQEVEDYIRDTTAKFQSNNINLGTKAIPIAALIKGLVRNTGLSEDTIIKKLAEMGISLVEKPRPEGYTRPTKPMTARRVRGFMRRLANTTPDPDNII